MTFTSSNWNKLQHVVISANNDAFVNGDVTATVTLSTSSEGDSIYNELESITLPITIIDNDVAGIEYLTTDLTVTEGGEPAARAFKLKSQPTSDVTLRLSADTYADRISISPSQLTFTQSDWNALKHVTFTAANDDTVNGTTMSIINVTVSSSDKAYSDISVPSFNVIVNDNDTSGLVYVSSPVTITEGSHVVRAFKLKSEPKFNVTVNFTYEHDDRLTVTPSYITFTKSNWNVEHTVTLSAVDNSAVDGDITIPVNISSVSDDSDYNGITGVITVTVNDNDVSNKLGKLAFTTGTFTVDNSDFIRNAIDHVYHVEGMLSGYNVPMQTEYSLLYSDYDDPEE